MLSLIDTKDKLLLPLIKAYKSKLIVNKKKTIAKDTIRAKGHLIIVNDGSKTGRLDRYRKLPRIVKKTKLNVIIKEEIAIIVNHFFLQILIAIKISIIDITNAKMNKIIVIC